MAAASPSAGPAPQNKPDNTAFTQQRLPAWQPLLSAGIALPLFFCVGLACLALGLGLYFSSATIREWELDYTGAPGSGHNCSRCANHSRAGAGAGARSCYCLLHFELPEHFPGPVCLYYQLSNYYQNHRRYGVSRDDLQLSGDAWGLNNPAQECSPFQTDPQGRPIAPCGAIANSLFNDTFALYHLVKGTLSQVPLDNRGISWWTDSNIKFSNPELVNGSLNAAFRDTVKPPNWPIAAYQLDTGNLNNTGFINEDFIVWMRTAALPTFRKLYRRVRQGNFSSGLPQGSYILNITYNYPVLSFQGTKKVVFSTVSWMGGKNPFLGIAYLVFGSTCILTGFVMLAVHVKYQQQNQMDVE